MSLISFESIAIGYEADTARGALPQLVMEKCSEVAAAFWVLVRLSHGWRPTMMSMENPMSVPQPSSFHMAAVTPSTPHAVRSSAVTTSHTHTHN